MQRITEPQLSIFIAEYAQKNIPQEHQLKFIQDTQSGLLELAPFTIAGLGITQEELKNWQSKS